MEEDAIHRGGLSICVLACITLAALGVSPAFALATGLLWLLTLWLARPHLAPVVPAPDSTMLTIDQLAPIIDASSLPLLVIDRDRIVAANSAARSALGEHVIGEDPRVALRHPDAVALLAGERQGSIAVRGLTTARSHWVLRMETIAPFRIVEMIDQTIQSDVSRAHTDFVANASHELRTPLSVIIGYAETLSDEKSGLDPVTRARFLDTVEREARRLASLVEDLMSLSRIEAEKHDAPDTRIDLAALTAVIVGDVRTVSGATRVEFSPPPQPVTIPGDRGQVEQLIRNLIDNAIKYGDPVKPVSVRLAVDADATIRLEIQDQGPGIATEHLPHLTRRFYRVDAGRSRASGGTGLGLAIVKHIVERHRGKLHIDSVVGQGTTVIVTFPRGL